MTRDHLIRTNIYTYGAGDIYHTLLSFDRLANFDIFSFTEKRVHQNRLFSVSLWSAANLFFVTKLSGQQIRCFEKNP